MRSMIAAAALLLTTNVRSAPAKASLEQAERTIAGLERLGETACPPGFTNAELLDDLSRGALGPAAGGDEARLGARLYFF